MTHAAPATFADRYLEFFDHWNAERFWEAHEALEDLWRRTNDANRLFLQGLIQAAGAFYHIQRRRWDPSRVLFDQSLAYLGTYEPSGVWEGLDLRAFCATLRAWRAEVAARFVDAAAAAEPLRPYPRAGIEPAYAAQLASVR